MSLSIQERLKDLRVERGLTLGQLAEQTGLSKSCLLYTSYKTLTGKKKAAKANPKITALQVELAHVDSEIEKLVDSPTNLLNLYQLGS